MTQAEHPSQYMGTITQIRPPVQGDLFSAALRADEGMAAAENHADPDWIAKAEWVIRTLVPGTEFLAEELVARIEAGGVVTHDRKALGPVIRRASVAGLIEKTGAYRPAVTSNLQPKPVWRRK